MLFTPKQSPNHWCLEPLSHPDPTLSFIPHEILSTLPSSSHPFAHYMNPAFNPFLKIAESSQHLSSSMWPWKCRSLKEVDITPHSLSSGWAWWLHSRGDSTEGRWERTFTVNKSDRHYLTWWSRSRSTINIMLTVCTSDMMWWQLALCPQDLLSQKLHNPSLIMRKSPKWGTLHKNLISTLHNHQDHQKREKSHCQSQEEPKMIWWFKSYLIVFNDG